MKEKNVMKQTPPSDRAVESLGYLFSFFFPFSLGLRISFHDTTPTWRATTPSVIARCVMGNPVLWLRDSKPRISA